MTWTQIAGIAPRSLDRPRFFDLCDGDAGTFHRFPHSSFDDNQAMKVLPAAATAFMLAGPVLAGQQPSPAAAKRPTFEVASIKATRSTAPDTMNETADRLVILQTTAWSLVHYAYELTQGRISGGPSWARSQRFDVTAKSEQPTTFREKMQMLQSLLEDRFKLQLHSESRKGDVWALVVARSDGRLGPNLRRTSAECVAFYEAQDRREAVAQRPLSCAFAQPRTLGVNGFTMAGFASMLSARSRQMIVDRTGLVGRFDLDLTSSLEGLVQPSVSSPDAAGPSGQTIFTALTEQLGLRLERQQGIVETLVIDQLEMPTPD
jgi:uncharacterized protein (TIGR03435 family)